MTNEENIYCWIDGHYKRAKKEADFIWLVDTFNTSYVRNSHRIKVIIDGVKNTVTVVNTEKPKRFGVSKCRSDDVFNYELGVALAYARYSKETIPNYILNM